MKTLTVTLKQHTPLIHFQHSQYGATLRASEVKPKLDRYVFSLKSKVEAKKLGWTKGKDDDTLYLNYKLKISSNTTDTSVALEVSPRTKFNERSKTEETIYGTQAFPLLLSNMGGKSEKEKLVNFVYSNTVELSFYCDENNGLCDYIKQVLPTFFANTNWGQRKDKGFGSFTVIRIDNKEVKWNPETLYDPQTQLMFYEVTNVDNFVKFQILFSVIDFYWKYLKSGINYNTRFVKGNKIERKEYDENKPYKKAFLFKYLESKNITWEKRIVKTELNLICVPASNDIDRLEKENNNPYFFARAHLGCPINGIAYSIPTGKISSIYNKRLKKEKQIEVNDRVDISIENNRSKEVERIASPIIFKPVFHKDKFFIYVLFDEDTKKALAELKDVTFTFTRLWKQSKKPDSRFKPVQINLFPKKEPYVLDYYDLIESFHKKECNGEMIVRDNKWNNILGEGHKVFFTTIKELNKDED